MGLGCCVGNSKDTSGLNESLLGRSGANIGPAGSTHNQRFSKNNYTWEKKQRALRETLSSGVNKKQRPMVTLGYELWRSPCKLVKARHWQDSDQGNVMSTSLADLLQNRTRVILTGFPGCFVGNCSRYHIPEYHRTLEALKKAGIELVICISVNDPYTQQAWLDSLKLPETSGFGLYADPHGHLVSEIGMCLRPGNKSIGGVRSRRFTLVLANGVVEHIFVEDSPEEFEKTQPDNIISALTLNPHAHYMQDQHYMHIEPSGSAMSKQSSSVLSIG